MHFPNICSFGRLTNYIIVIPDELLFEMFGTTARYEDSVSIANDFTNRNLPFTSVVYSLQSSTAACIMC